MVLKKRARNFDIIDIGLIKWSSILFALFVVSVWSGFASWVLNTHWIWFFAASLLLGIRPICNFFKKS